jgi:hypothetical protein
MPGPTLTPEEIAQCKSEAAKATSAAATFTAQIAAQTARAAQLGIVDGAFKKFFDYYSAIITSYDTERKQIDGMYIAAPIIEQDVLDCANGTGRIVPSLPATDAVRISQFDGTPLVTNPTYELLAISKQADAENVLVNGYGAGTYAVTTVTATPLTPTSTTLQLMDTTATFTIAPGSVFIVSTLTDFAVVVVDTFVPVTSPVPPPYVQT